MNNKAPRQEIKKVTLSGKVPPRIKARLEEIAKTEDRSVSHVFARLLESHPELNKQNLIAVQA